MQMAGFGVKTSVGRHDGPRPEESRPLTASGVLLKSGETVRRRDGSGDSWLVIEILKDNLVRVKHSTGKQMTTQACLWDIYTGQDASAEAGTLLPSAEHEQASVEPPQSVLPAVSAYDVPAGLTSQVLRRVVECSRVDPLDDGVEWDELMDLLWGTKTKTGLLQPMAELALERILQIEATQKPEEQLVTKTKMGRPPKDPAVVRDRILNVRFTEDEMRLLEAAAKESKMKLSDWVRDTLLAVLEV